MKENKAFYRAKTGTVVVLLVDIRSVFNVGSVFRTADGAGVAKIYCGGITPTPLDRLGRFRGDFSKVALGSERTMPWEHVPDPRRVLADLRARGFLICAVEQSRRSFPYWRAIAHMKKEKRPICFVLGSERGGLPTALVRKADRVAEIPMKGAKESLNVSIAFAIVAYETMRQSCVAGSATSRKKTKTPR